MTSGSQPCSRVLVPVRVFLFEDHWMHREALVRVLGQDETIEVVGAAEDAQESLERAIEIQPDVVLMDVMFGGRPDGIDATITLKARLPATRVIIFTEQADETILQRAIGAGASGLLLKPEVQDPDVVARAIHTVHRGDGYLTPAMTERVLAVVRRLAKPNQFDLTRREVEVLELLVEGKDNRRIGQELAIDERTVAKHVGNLLFKMSAKNRTEAAAIARKEQILR
jgi:DNA-binding NarL/FixJ family response regulator